MNEVSSAVINRNHNDPAFPITGVGHGISRLEFFAAAALPDALERNYERAKQEGQFWPTLCKAIAVESFDIAEAMCTEAEQRRKQ